MIQTAKIRLARKRLGLSMDELVARMGSNAVSKNSLSKFERGILHPSLATLAAIAAACQVDIGYFQTPQIEVGSMHFRFRNDLTNKRISEFKASIKYEIERRFETDSFSTVKSKFTNPFKNKTIMHYEDAEIAADIVRKKWGIGTQAIHSVYETLEEQGIMVIEMKIQCNDLEGISTWINGAIPAIIINTFSHTTTERKRFTALHELAHLLFKFSPKTEENVTIEKSESIETSHKKPDVERLCHRFAGAMLISTKSLHRRLGDKRSDLSLAELISIRNMYGISIAATIHRAHDINIIPDKTYKRLFDNLIESNKLEIGWGGYPIEETADRKILIEEMIKTEFGE